MNKPEQNSDDATVINTLMSEAPNDETVMQSPLNDDATRLSTAAAEEPAKTLQVGTVLQNRFVLKEVLGSGGMGTVFRATDLRRQEAQDHQPDVAIKVLNEEFRDDPELFIALQRETKKSQILAHPNIVTVYDFDRDGHHVFMVMELLQGKPLSAYLRDEGAGGIPFKKAWHIIKGLALALAYAHKKNIIHSDFKPGNVFITSDGEVKVLDFGIACAAVRSDSHADETVFNARDLGALTPAYASLEMLQGADPDPADDVYALACVSYEILAGKHPFAKLSAQKALDVNLQVPVIPGLDRRQRQALAHALAFRREQRTPTVAAFLDEIESKSVWPKVFAGAAIVAIIAVAGSYFYVFQEWEFVDDEIIQLTPEQELAVKDFLELAQIHFEVGYLTAPSGSNAMWAYRQVLKIDPYNQPAQKGLQKIADAVEQQALGLYATGNYQTSLAKIEEGLEAVPKHEHLLKLKDQILESRRAGG
ncbi:serine/threonine-protein kinase [Methylomarinum sp. Ch1-1]|uniref:Serine/threonine-protein kinase n=1 Tax=Methylomarinum roseum TaxID=3067653 RepID=A0AAU7NSN7_9GAMM